MDGSVGLFIYTNPNESHPLPSVRFTYPEQRHLPDIPLLLLLQVRRQPLRVRLEVRHGEGRERQHELFFLPLPGIVLVVQGQAPGRAEEEAVAAGVGGACGLGRLLLRAAVLCEVV